MPPETSPVPLPLAALDGLLFPVPEGYTAVEVAGLAGVDEATADRLWRAMGFTTPPADEPAFGPDDRDALRSAAEVLARGVPLEDVVYQTRVTAASLSRIAEISSDAIVAELDGLRTAGLDDEQIAQAFRERGSSVGEFDRLLSYFYRRQLRAALWRKLAGFDGSSEKEDVVVGFVDLVRFTALTEHIAEDELGELIDRFETEAHERITGHAGRIIKMIGDEVMFVSDDPASAVDAALELVDEFERDDTMPPARAGLACGPVLAYGGDCFGPIVNLAARIVSVARPSSVVVPAEIHARMEGRADLSWRRLPPKRLKGIGRPPLWAVSPAQRLPRRAGPAPQ